MGRAPCCNEAGVKKGPWTPEEDQKLIDYIQTHGHGSWRSLPKLAGLNRCGKSCRLRWTNYLRPDIKRGKFTEEEEKIIISLHSVLGNKWSAIATNLPGRTDNEIKNFWNTHLRKKLLQMGIDPVTHNPRTDLNFLASFPQLIAAANFGSLLSPWDNALKLQTDVAQLARIQLIQSLLQVITTNAPLNMEAVSQMGSASFRDFQLNDLLQSSPQYKGLVDGSLGQHLTAVSSDFPNFGIPELVDNYPTLAESSFCSEGQEAVGAIDIPGPKSINNDHNDTYNTINHMASSHNMVPTSPNHFTQCQMKDQINQTDISTHSSTSTTFEACGELNLDYQSNDYCWRDILDQTASPSWPTPL